MSRFGLSLLLALALHGCDGPDGSGSQNGEAPDSTDPGPVQGDADDDSILDIHEGTGDDDGDSTSNMDDDDSDGDSIFDRIEAGDDDLSTLPVDSDGDSLYDYLDLDSDGNCVGDAVEAGRADGEAVDTDEDGVRDFQDIDNDGDGMLDIDENGSCESPSDHDGDGTPNYLDLDSDNDGIGDVYESGATGFSSEPVDSDDDTIPDFLDEDSDGDSISDSEESGTDGNPLIKPRDLDGDGRYDYADTDADGDSLSDDRELSMGTNPYDADTDGDGFSDGGEDTAGTDPLDPDSRIEGIYVVVPERTDVEENFEFELNIEKGDIAFIVDTTCSMGGTITAITTEFSQIVEELSELLPDAAYGVGGHDDYMYGTMGSTPDKPFYLRQQITPDLDAVQDGLSSLGLHNGWDGTESGFEALYQGASGAGYDQDCDGTFDSTQDVYPFLASKDDPFGGTAGEHFDPGTTDAGTIGGFGFREYALPIIVIASDNYLRDPDTSGYYSPSPGGCPMDAGFSAAVSAFTDIGAYFVGVEVGAGAIGYPQMISFAQATGSYADFDGDGVADEEAVQVWRGSNEAFREAIVEAITELVASVRFERVDLSVEDDIYGFVTSIDPAFYKGLDAGDTGSTLTFTLTFRGSVAATSEDQLYKLTLNVLGDSTVLLDSLDIIVQVPGTAF